VKYCNKEPHHASVLLVTYLPNYTVLLPRTSPYICYNKIGVK